MFYAFEHSTWSSVSYGSDFIVIDTVDPERCLVQGCRYYITVAGARDSYFSLTASTTGGTTLLVGGVKVFDSVTLNASDPYSFVYSGKTIKYLKVVLEAVGSGPRINAYITTDDYPPSAEYYQYYLSQDYTTSIISNTPCHLDSCVLLITVVGTGKYSITAWSDETITPISDQTVTGTMISGYDMCYSRTFGQNAIPFNFVLHLKGYVTAYLACASSSSSSSSSAVTKPNSTHHSWSVQSWDIAKLVIPVTGDAATNCFHSGDGSRVLINLFMNDYSTYSIRAYIANATNHDDAPEVMEPGKSISRIIDDADFQYFTIRPHNSGGDIRSVAVFVSICVLCVMCKYAVSDLNIVGADLQSRVLRPSLDPISL